MTVEIKHGPGGYTNSRCRCLGCRAASAQAKARQRASRWQIPAGDKRHGKESTYVEGWCRWDCCRAAAVAAQRVRRERRRRRVDTPTGG